MQDKLLTAADLDKLPLELKAKIVARNRQKGSDYERVVAKKIAGYFGFKWDEAFYRTKPHGRAQPDGDLKPINQMAELWKSAGLGPIECKNRVEWSFSQFFRNPIKSKVYEYWLKSNTNTLKNNSIIFVTKPGVPDLVFYQCERNISELACFGCFCIQINDIIFVMQTLQSFLQLQWPDPQNIL